MPKRPKNIVVMGGGTGTFAVLSGLRDSGHNLTAIVTMADHGGSSGMLRDELGVLPPGDIRQCLVALSRAHATVRQLFTHRFSEGSLRGHTLGNLFLAALEDMTGNFEKAVEVASETLQICGRVVPVTLRKTELYARLANGSLLSGEPAITGSQELKRTGVKRLYLRPSPRANPKAIEAILAADLFVMAPGNLYSSLIPNLLVKDIPEAIAQSRARKVYVCNLMTKYGQTEGFAVHHFVDELEKWALRPSSGQARRPLFDVVLHNIQQPPEAALRRYQKEGVPVGFDKGGARARKNVRFVAAPLLSQKMFLPSEDDPLAHQRSFIRHDPQKLAQALLELLRPIPLPLWWRKGRGGKDGERG